MTMERHRRGLAFGMLHPSMLALLVVLFAGCSDRLIVEPPALPTGATEFTPMAAYETWWRETEDCSGQTGDLARVHWFVVPNSGFFPYKGQTYDGYWWSEIHWIILASAYQADGPTVRHEMLHDLLNRGDHPASYFQGKCAGVVECNTVCQREGTP